MVNILSNHQSYLLNYLSVMLIYLVFYYLTIFAYFFKQWLTIVKLCVNIQLTCVICYSLVTLKICHLLLSTYYRTHYILSIYLRIKCKLYNMYKIHLFFLGKILSWLSNIVIYDRHVFRCRYNY